MSHRGTDHLRHHDLTHRIIGAFYDVYGELGAGFLERLYQVALMQRLQELTLPANAEVSFSVHYHGCELGTFMADIVVDGLVLLELKAVDTLVSHHEKQIINYLRASGLEVGLLLNFGPKPQVRRFIQDRILESQPPRCIKVDSDSNEALVRTPRITRTKTDRSVQVDGSARQPGQF